MAFSNAYLEIRLGNVESRLVGPAPIQLLDRELNGRLGLAYGAGRADGEEERTEADRPALVYHPTRDVFLTGALAKVKRVLRRAGVRFRIRDLRRVRRRVGGWRLVRHELRDYQEDVVRRALERGSGLIDIGTGGGKTLLAAAIIARLGLPTIYLVTTRTLLAQTVDNLQSYLGVKPGVVGEGVRRPERLTVALIQALDPERVDLEEWRAGLLVFDEGHHAAAGSWQDLVRRLAPRYRFFLSAVPFRSGRDQILLEALAGERLTGGRYSARFLIEKGYACPVEVRVERCRIAGEMTEKPFTSLYREFIVENAARNKRIVAVARAEAGAGRSVLVLVEHVRHGRRLMRGLGDEACFVHGSVPRSELHETTARFTDGRLRCLVATSALFQEGVSIDGIEVLVQAGGLKSRSKVIQTVGRGMRRAPGKNACAYVDFYDDDDAGVFQNHSRERLEVLKEEGFLVPAMAAARKPGADETPIPPTWSHIPGTNRFVLVDGDGRVTARAVCMEKKLVPEGRCKKCEEQNVCERGGRITWRGGRA